ncbi:unnamed protein product [Pleuronectes platessa]|uniref:Uncharacterized protein n=1 Tax=Pleuronectes platessa TaxID=8262 RepID=A0A9N7TLR0_PLEPL|nr:unnamed protein product [Pleuronectes platessa]
MKMTFARALFVRHVININESLQEQESPSRSRRKAPASSLRKPLTHELLGRRLTSHFDLSPSQLESSHLAPYQKYVWVGRLQTAHFPSGHSSAD